MPSKYTNSKKMTYANLYAILVNFLGYVYPIRICLPILQCDAEGDADAVLEVLVEGIVIAFGLERRDLQVILSPLPIHDIMKPQNQVHRIERNMPIDTGTGVREKGKTAIDISRFHRSGSGTLGDTRNEHVFTHLNGQLASDIEPEHRSMDSG